MTDLLSVIIDQMKELVSNQYKKLKFEIFLWDFLLSVELITQELNDKMF